MSRSLSSYGMLRAFRHRDFALFALGGWSSSMGLWVQRIAVAWLTWELTKSGTWLGIVAAAEAIPTIALIPFAGVIMDRFERLTVARFIQIGGLLVSAILALLTFAGWINAPLLAVLMIFSGATEAFWTPARLTIAPNLVPREDLAAASSIGAIMFNLSRIFGPMISGVIIHIAGPAPAFAFNAVSFGIFLIILFMIQLQQQEQQSRRGTTVFGDLKDGILYLMSQSSMLSLFLFMLAAAFCLRGYIELLPGFAEEVFDRGPGAFTILVSASGIGAIVGALYVGNRPGIAGLTSVVFLALLVQSVFQIAFSVTSIFWIAVGFSAVMGATITVSGIGTQILFQNAVAGHMRGRVMSLWGLIIRVAPALGTMAMGTLADFWGFQIPVLIGAVLYLVLWFVIARRRERLAYDLEAAPPTS